MQIAGNFGNGNGVLPPSQGGSTPVPPAIAEQIRSQHARYKRILRQRSIKFWWPRILLIVLGGIVAAVDGQFFLLIWKPTLGCAVAAPILIWMFRRVEVGLFFTGLVATALVPKAVDIKSLVIYPSIPFLFLLFGWLIVKTAFHEHKPVLPSFKVIWPFIGLLTVVIVSTVLGQYMWDKSVPHRVNQFPILYDEIVGVVMYFIPIITIVTTTAALSRREDWVEYIQRMFLIVAIACSLILIIDFKRIGGSVETFRFTEPSVGWMTLRALAQIIGLGGFIAYARFLYSTTWRARIVYLVCLVLCLLALYFSLQNSWWFEAAAGLAVMTIFYSRKLFFACILAIIPATPLIMAEEQKLQTLKSDDYYRLIIWQDILRVWHKRPWFGVGPGNLWAYDQHYTGLPIGLRNCSKSGLCVAHEGYLQILGEIGPFGEIFWLSMIALLIFTAVQLCRRSKLDEKPDRGFWGLIGLRLPAGPVPVQKPDPLLSPFGRWKQKSIKWPIRELFKPNYEPQAAIRKDRILGMICLGLLTGSMAGDLFTSNFFLPPRQAYHTVQLPQVLTYWIMYGCLLYKDKLWRNAQTAALVAGRKMRVRRVIRAEKAVPVPVPVSADGTVPVRVMMAGTASAREQ